MIRKLGDLIKEPDHELFPAAQKYFHTLIRAETRLFWNVTDLCEHIINTDIDMDLLK